MRRLKIKHIKEFVEITGDLADPLRRGMLAKIDFLQSIMVRFPMEEAIEFAKKYLADRRGSYVIAEMCKICETWIGDNDHVHDANTLSGQIVVENKTAKAWDVAVEYILNDIIPYLYGDALD